ncbi:cyclase family protein [Croceicoccus sp. BE223]|uniref:cyclase family protein n=1 Tax=Croceicoccus sp. BE223 TaxID=2817716 RepID=UPI00285F20CF|nr:cyclase family protein [Croceicoccus sp. BE223]MDR7103742.1 kynurenine formamidase [Croceicoccus sp. BE223]
MSFEYKSANAPAKRPDAGPWWPSRWGAEDERGALNLIGQQQALSAARRIKTGDVVEMGFPFESGKPDFHHRDFHLASAGGPSGGPVGSGKFMYNDEVIAGNITGMSTHFNALVHVGQQLGNVGDNNTVHYYNGHSHAEIGGPWGFRKLGVEKVDPIFTTGIVIDVAGLRGRPLDISEIITRQDLLDALDRQGLDEGAIAPGSALFWRTGRGSYYFTDREKYISGAPGIEPATAEWLCDKDVVVVGADAVAMEPVPPISDALTVVHATFLCRRGVYVIVNVNLEPLAKREAWQFAFSCTPIPFVGAQGSPSRPFAIV